MRFWVVAGSLYGGVLLASLLLPAAALSQRQPLDAARIFILIVAVLTVALAAFLAALLLARGMFPEFWWMGQVLGQDIFEFEGVYFLGLRLSRVPTRLQRLLFSADDRFRWYDLLFGLMFLVLLVPHGLAAATAYRRAEVWFPRQILFPETLHTATLSAFPIMREWGEPWSANAVLRARLADETELLTKQASKSDSDWFRLAQVHLLRAFTPRQNVVDPYGFSPSDRVYFDHGRGAQATAILNPLVQRSRGGGSPFLTDAIALLAFYQMSDTNYRRSAELFLSAMEAMDTVPSTAVPRPLLTLLTAQSAVLSGELPRGTRLLEALLSDEGLPAPYQALALEHLADNFRLDRRYSPALQLLQKAEDLYERQQNSAGKARVSMRRGAVYLEQDQVGEASREISRASSLVAGTGDVFTFNMVERITHLLPAAR